MSDQKEICPKNWGATPQFFSKVIGDIHLICFPQKVNERENWSQNNGRKKSSGKKLADAFLISSSDYK